MKKSVVVLSLVISLLVAALSACSGFSSGGGGGGTAVIITPSLGQFSTGATVKIKKLDGTLIVSGTVADTGAATVMLPVGTTGPLLIEAGFAGDKYFDEKSNKIETIPVGTIAAMRAITPDASRNVIGVTPLTEAAVMMLGAEISTATAASIALANAKMEAVFGMTDILQAPTPVSATTKLGASAADKYALILAAMAHLAANGMTALDVSNSFAEDMKDNVFDGKNGSVTVNGYVVNAGNAQTIIMVHITIVINNYGSPDVKANPNLVAVIVTTDVSAIIAPPAGVVLSDLAQAKEMFRELRTTALSLTNPGNTGFFDTQATRMSADMTDKVWPQMSKFGHSVGTIAQGVSLYRDVKNSNTAGYVTQSVTSGVQGVSSMCSTNTMPGTTVTAVGLTNVKCEQQDYEYGNYGNYVNYGNYGNSTQTPTVNTKTPTPTGYTDTYTFTYTYTHTYTRTYTIANTTFTIAANASTYSYSAIQTITPYTDAYTDTYTNTHTYGYEYECTDIYTGTDTDMCTYAASFSDGGTGNWVSVGGSTPGQVTVGAAHIGSVSPTYTGTLLTSLTASGDLPRSEAGAVKDTIAINFSRTATAVTNVYRYSLTGSARSLAANGAPLVTLSLDSGSFFDNQENANGVSAVNSGRAATIIGTAKTSATQFTGTFVFSSPQVDLSGLHYIPTVASFNGKLYDLTISSSVPILNGTLTATAINYPMFNATLDESSSNFLRGSVSFTGTVQAPNRPLMTLTLGASRVFYSEISTTLNYTYGAVSLTGSGKIYTNTKSCTSDAFALSNQNGVQITVTNAKTAYPAYYGGGCYTSAVTGVVDKGVGTAKLAEIIDGAIHYADGYFESL